MKKEKILIRADGSTEIGLGHLVRCLALAHMLKENFFISFYAKEITEKISLEIRKAGFERTLIKNENDLLEVLTGEEIVVLDHYGLGPDYQQEIKKKGSKLVCIDDLHDKEFYADLIINHSPGIKAEDYQAQNYTRFALGLDYALLRPEFLELAKRKKEIREIETVLICFGGSDPRNLTREVLSIIKEYESFQKINIVLGSGYNFKKSLNEIAENDEKIEIFESLNESQMASVVHSADLAIIPASGILLETIAAGPVPLICCSADNQKKLFGYFKENSSIASFQALDFDRKSLEEALEEIINNKTNFDRDYWRRKVKSSPTNHLFNFNHL